MSLVSYYDNSENESDTEEENGASQIEDSVNPEDAIDVVEEEYRMRIPAAAQREQESAASKPTLNPGLGVKRKFDGRIQLTIPTLDQFDSSDDDEDEDISVKKAKMALNTKPKGAPNLLSLLPQPRTVASNGTSAHKPVLMVPKSVSRPPLPPKTIPTLPDTQEEEEEETGGSSFFSFYDTVEADKAIAGSASVSMAKQRQKIEEEDDWEIPEVTSSSYAFHQHYTESPQTMAPDMYPQDEAYMKMVEEEARKSKKKRGGEASGPHIVEVNQSDLTAGSQIELTKGITQEAGSRTSHRAQKDDMPGKTASRKHQITWLAYKAKEREFDLQNQWSDAKYSKQQTQNKYGF